MTGGFINKKAMHGKAPWLRILAPCDGIIRIRFKGSSLGGIACRLQTSQPLAPPQSCNEHKDATREVNNCRASAAADADRVRSASAAADAVQLRFPISRW